MRRQGVRAESLLKDGDNLIQRYRNLEARLQRQAEAQSSLEGECDKFSMQAESTRAWISDLLQPLTSADMDTHTEGMKDRAQVSEGEFDIIIFSPNVAIKLQLKDVWLLHVLLGGAG